MYFDFTVLMIPGGCPGVFLEGMIQKMSDSNKQSKYDRQQAKKKKKLDASLKNLSARQRREAMQEQKEARRTHLYLAVAAVVAVLIVALLIWDNGIFQRRLTAVTVGNKSYSVADVDYYYYSQYNSAMTYSSIYGIDTSVSLKEQEAYEGTSWYDYFMEAAKSSLTTVSMLAQEAEAADYTISEEGQANIDEAMNGIDEACKEYGVSTGYYLHQMFGRYMNKAKYKQIMTEYFYAYDYEAYKTESFEISDEEIDDYYAENKDTLDTYDIDAYYISATPETQYDEDGNEIDATEEEITAAATDAKKSAKALQAALKADDEAKITAQVESSGATDRSVSEGSSVSNYTYGTWVVDSERKAGDTTVIEDSTTDDDEKTTINGYYVVRFNSRAREDYYPVSFRNILVQADEVEAEADSSAAATTTEYDYDAAKTKIEGVEQTWKDNGGTEDAFAELTEENSADASSNYNGGLYEDVLHDQFDEAVNEWLFDESRKAGDTTIVQDETNKGYQFLYFVGTNDIAAWQQTAKSALQSDAYDKWFSDTIENYEAETSFMYRYVG